MRNIRSAGTGLPRGLRVLAAVAMIATLVFAAASGAAPPAGTSIGNQASATYTDTSLVSRTVTSGTVTTIVQQVAGLALTASQSRLVAPGGTAYFPHTLSNSGNGTDTFTLSAVDAGTGTITFTALVIYADADGNGVPDDATPLGSSGALAAGSIFRFVVAATGGAAAAQTEEITVTATSVFDAGVTATNTDTVTVSGNAVLAMTKAVSSAAGPSPSTSPLTYTLTFTNTGNSAATALTITDTIPAGLAYRAGSGRWSVTGSTALTDDTGNYEPNGAAPRFIDYDYGITLAGRITAIINTIGAGQTDTLSFQVDVDSGLPPQTINNTAAFTYNDGSVIRSSGSNTVGYNVLQTAAVTVTDSGSSTDDNGVNDVVYETSAVQGAIVPFDVVVVNGGSGSDTFNITLSGSTFPGGTTFIHYKSDGVSPLVDTSGDSAPDTGPVSAGASYHVFVKAVLPPGTSGGGPYDVIVRGTSTFDGTATDPTTARLGTITASTVDLTNNTARSDSSPAGTAASGNAATTGWGAGPGSGSVVSNTVNPGAATTFRLVINNTSGVADSYDLAASTVANFASITLPAGWTMSFKADGGTGDCSTTGATITGTGVINAGSNRLVCAVVNVPSSALAGDTALYFRAQSPTTGATDRIWDQVSVNAVRSLSVTPNNPGQVFPGGTVAYLHLITNDGNVTEGALAGLAVLGLTNTGDNWTSTLYWDRNNDGALDGSDPTVSDLSELVSGTGGASTAAGLDAGETARLFVKVFAPSGASAGDVDTATLTATVSGAILGVAAPAPASATDISTIIAGQVRLEKLQALDAACDGTADTAFSSANITAGALPGACIRYHVTAINEGTGDVTSVVVSDSTPANTVYDDGSRNSRGGACGSGPVDAAAATTVGSTTAPACNSTGTIQATLGALTPSQQAIITFGVMINP